MAKKLNFFQRIFTKFNKKKTKINKKTDLLTITLNIIDYANRGILIDMNNKILKDFNPDMQKMQKVFDSIENKRIDSFVGERSYSGGVDIAISSEDIKAVMFKPIIRMSLQNSSIIEGRSQFKRIWNFTKITLYDNLENLTEDKIQNAIIEVENNITSFEKYVLSNLSENPKNWNEFIEAILDSIPTAFGKPSL